MLDASDRALWSAVVLQVWRDIASLPIGSVDFNNAQAFARSGAARWVQARAEVAAHLDYTADDIKHAGERWVLARRRAAGLPDHAPPRAAPVPEVKPALVIPQDLRDVLAVQRRRRRLPEENPFHPRAA